MAVTIKDIAKHTNLSITTVSLVLNNKADRIPERTKKLVLKTAKELNYLPNQLAIGLRNRKTKTVGLLLPDIRNNFFSALAKYSEDACRSKGWTLILCNTGDHYRRDIDYINVLASKKVDGILYCMSADTDKAKFAQIYSLLHSLNMPCVMMDRSYEFPDLAAVKINHKLGGYEATKHLLSIGHRRIACITGPAHLKESHDRILGYQMALEEYRVPYEPALIYEGNYQMSGGQKGIQSLRNTPYTAVFCCNDLMAFGALQALRKQNKKVPDDVSLVGYDDIIFAKMLDVPLTTIRQPIGKVGSTAVEKLIQSIEENEPIENVPIFDPELVVRESTQPVD